MIDFDAFAAAYGLYAGVCRALGHHAPAERTERRLYELIAPLEPPHERARLVDVFLAERDRAITAGERGWPMTEPPAQ